MPPQTDEEKASRLALLTPLANSIGYEMNDNLTISRGGLSIDVSAINPELPSLVDVIFTKAFQKGRADFASDLRSFINFK